LTERRKKYHPFPSPPVTEADENDGKLYIKYRKDAGWGREGIKHLTKMSRVFRGWFLEGGVGLVGA
jgi:hypothetical protein